MKRDTVVPVLTFALAVLALSTGGLTETKLLPATPGAYYAAALILCAAFFLAVPPARRLGAVRPAVWLLAALPFLVFGVLGGAWQRPGGWLPTASWFLLAACTWSFGLARRPARLSAGALLLLGGGAVLATAGLSVVPRAWNPLLQPLPTTSGAAPAETGPITGLRRGAPVRQATGSSPLVRSGAVWYRATRESRPGPRPVVLVLDGAARDASHWSSSEMTVVAGAAFAFSEAVDLLAFDVVIAREVAWAEDDPAASAKARAVAGFARKGGLLVGPAPGRPWPSGLGRLLRGAGGRQLRGVAGIERLGLGRVARAVTRNDVVELLSAGAWVPPVASRLAAAMPPAPLPSERFTWRDTPGQRRPQGVLLLVYACFVGALTWLARRRAVQVLALVLAAGAVSVALVWLAPSAPGLRVEGFVTDLGGPGGRRHEAVVLSAGPEGFEGRVTWASGGVLALHGARLSAAGRVQIPPGRTAWIIREVDAVGVRPEESEDRGAVFLRALLLGDADPRHMRFGRLPALPLTIEGIGPVPAWTVTVKSP